MNNPGFPSIMNTKHFFYILPLFFVINVQAEVYKCKDEYGHTTFSEKPCGENAEVLNINTRKAVEEEPLPESSLLLADGSVQPFKKILSIEVKTKSGFKTGEEGLHVYYNGTDHIVEFENLVSMKIIDYDIEPCGNTAHLCKPKVVIQTTASEIDTEYEALRNVKVLIDDDLTGEESELVVWFATDYEPRIKQIMF